MTKQNISLTFSLLMQSNGSNASIWSTSEMEQGINLLSVSRHSRPNPVYTVYITNYNGFSLILMCSVARVLCICYDSQNFIFFAYFNRVFNRLSNLMQCHLDFLRVSLPSNIKYVIIYSLSCSLLEIKVLHDAIEEPFCLNGSIKNL